MECSLCWVVSQTLPSWKRPPNLETVSTTGGDWGSQGGWTGPKVAHTCRHTRAHVHAHIRAALDRTLHPALGCWWRGGQRGSSGPFPVKPGSRVLHLAQPEPPRLGLHCGDGPGVLGEPGALCLPHPWVQSPQPGGPSAGTLCRELAHTRAACTSLWFHPLRGETDCPPSPLLPH